MHHQPDLFEDKSPKALEHNRRIQEEMDERRRIDKVIADPKGGFFTKVGAFIDLAKLEWRSSR